MTDVKIKMKRLQSSIIPRLNTITGNRKICTMAQAIAIFVSMVVSFFVIRMILISLFVDSCLKKFGINCWLGKTGLVVR